MTTQASQTRHFFTYTIADAVEKLVRIDRILQQQSATAGTEYRGVVEILQSTLTQFRQLLTDNSLLIRKVLEQKDLEEYETVALQAIHQNLTKALYGIHEQLVFLPRERVEREVFFCLEDLFGNDWAGAGGSVILTTIYNAYEYRFLDVLQDNAVFEEKLPDIRKLQPFSPETSVLELPIIDRDNPLSWPLLAHEFGHTIDRRESIVKGIRKQLSEALGTQEKQIDVLCRWISEVFADFVAATVLGPVAMLPLFSLELGVSTLLDGPSPLTTTHPPTTFRLGQLRDYLKTSIGVSFPPFEQIVAIYQADQDRRLDSLDSKSRTAKADEESLLRYVFGIVGDDIVSSLRNVIRSPVSKDDLRDVDGLEKQLRLGVPIGSHRLQSDLEIQKGLKGIEMNGGGDARELYDALSSLDEVPCSTAQILTAGWLHKLSTYEDKLREVFSSEVPALSQYDDFLTHLDTLLLKSLQLSSAHRALTKHEINVSVRSEP